MSMNPALVTTLGSALNGNSVASSTGSANSAGSSGGGTSFGDFLSQAVDGTNQLLNQANDLAAQYAAGGNVSIDQLMIAEQQASLAVDLTVQTRDRVVSAYQTIMNMQI